MTAGTITEARTMTEGTITEAGTMTAGTITEAGITNADDIEIPAVTITGAKNAWDEVKSAFHDAATKFK
jgi:hypothetical protein